MLDFSKQDGLAPGSNICVRGLSLFIGMGGATILLGGSSFFSSSNKGRGVKIFFLHSIGGHHFFSFNDCNAKYYQIRRSSFFP